MPPEPKPAPPVSREACDAYLEKIFNIKDLPYDEQRVLLRSSVGKIVVFPDKLILFTVMQGEAYIIINKKGIC